MANDVCIAGYFLLLFVFSVARCTCITQGSPSRPRLLTIRRYYAVYVEPTREKADGHQLHPGVLRF